MKEIDEVGVLLRQAHEKLKRDPDTIKEVLKGELALAYVTEGNNVVDVNATDENTCLRFEAWEHIEGEGWFELAYLLIPTERITS